MTSILTLLLTDEELNTPEGKKFYLNISQH